MSKIKNIFQNSPVSPLFIAESINKHSAKTEIGAHQIFLGQIRADEIDG
ncbi:MAG: molybdenum cofactor biosynthesis protein MoaE, partial [Chryseobacterium gambrini]|nr:molybdenum cofactor biosynthesis protein MoaE [Chryseobacterium gambrini]